MLLNKLIHFGLALFFFHVSIAGATPALPKSTLNICERAQFWMEQFGWVQEGHAILPRMRYGKLRIREQVQVRERYKDIVNELIEAHPRYERLLSPLKKAIDQNAHIESAHSEHIMESLSLILPYYRKKLAGGEKKASSFTELDARDLQLGAEVMLGERPPQDWKTWMDHLGGTDRILLPEYKTDRKTEPWRLSYQATLFGEGRASRPNGDCPPLYSSLPPEKLADKRAELKALVNTLSTPDSLTQAINDSITAPLGKLIERHLERPGPDSLAALLSVEQVLNSIARKRSFDGADAITVEQCRQFLEGTLDPKIWKQTVDYRAPSFRPNLAATHKQSSELRLVDATRKPFF